MSMRTLTALVLSCWLLPSAPGGPAAAAEPPTAELKTAIVGWEEARAHKADWGEMRRYFTGETSATERVLVAVAVVQPGKAVHEAHRHAEEEYLALIEGSGTWWVDGRESPAKKGDILYVAPWVYHGLTNTGDVPLVFLVVRYNGKGVPLPPRPDDRPDELNFQGGGAAADRPETARVTGNVFFQGQPLAGAQVVFTPEMGPPAAGTTDAQGRFVLQTFEPGDGAVPGQYRVTIRAAEDNGQGNAAPGLRKFADARTSPLVVEIRAGANTLDFDLID